VVDDYSSDGGNETVWHIADNDQMVTLIEHEKNRGYSAAKNTGIRASTGSFIVHLDADDMLTPNAIETRLAPFLADPTIEFVHTKAYRFFGNQGYDWCIANQSQLEVHENVHIHAQGWMVKRSVYERYGLYYEGLRSKADKEMLWRWGLCKGQHARLNALAVSEPTAYYRRHDDTMIQYRKKNPEYDAEVSRIFKERQELYEEKGITSETVEML